jgi:hypothetical protein
MGQEALMPEALAAAGQHIQQCCAPQLPRQFGEGESVVFAGDMVSKTLTLCLKRSTKAGQSIVDHVR